MGRNRGIDGPAKRLPVCWDRYPEAVRLFLRGATLPTAAPVAAVVGTWLTVVNQGGRIESGSVPWLKVGLNFLTPFTVTSVGYLAARRRITLERLWRELHPDGSVDASEATWTRRSSD